MAREKRVDWQGALIATFGLAGLTYGFIDSASLGWTHFPVWGSLLAGVVSLVAFIYLEAYVESPLVPLQLFRSRDFSGANLLTLFLMPLSESSSFFSH